MFGIPSKRMTLSRSFLCRFQASILWDIQRIKQIPSFSHLPHTSFFLFSFFFSFFLPWEWTLLELIDMSMLLTSYQGTNLAQNTIISIFHSVWFIQCWIKPPVELQQKFHIEIWPLKTGLHFFFPWTSIHPSQEQTAMQRPIIVQIQI